MIPLEIDEIGLAACPQNIDLQRLNDKRSWKKELIAVHTFVSLWLLENRMREPSRIQLRLLLFGTLSKGRSSQEMRFLPVEICGKGSCARACDIWMIRADGADRKW